MLVKEVEPDVFLTWFGTNDLPASVEFTMTDEELAAHGLYRPLPEDTTGPTPYHVPTSTYVVRVAGSVHAMCNFELMSDVDQAREIATIDVQRMRQDAEAVALASWPYAGPDEHITSIFEARMQQHLAFIATASVHELSLRIWTWPAVEDLYA